MRAVFSHTSILLIVHSQLLAPTNKECICWLLRNSSTFNNQECPRCAAQRAIHAFAFPACSFHSDATEPFYPPIYAMHSIHTPSPLPPLALRIHEFIHSFISQPANQQDSQRVFILPFCGLHARTSLAFAHANQSAGHAAMPSRG